MPIINTWPVVQMEDCSGTGGGTDVVFTAATSTDAWVPLGVAPLGTVNDRAL